ncbi:hypothetical protein BC629DRAFT_320277 [Irpex lacteus]|nr:hypothetical protein BC629DRAFT_320277 [Irpex lacteus]
MSASINNKFVRPGIYEIQSSATSLFLNPPNGSGDRLEALTLNGQGLRAGKWEITKIGDGYTIRQVISGLFCALQNPVNCLDEPVVLSSMPTIWVIDMEDESEQIWCVHEPNMYPVLLLNFTKLLGSRVLYLT